MPSTLDIRADDVADKGIALEKTLEFSRAAREFARAADLYAFEREPAQAYKMTERAGTCRRAARSSLVHASR